MDEQLLLDELVFDLAQLHNAHAAAVGGEFAGGVLLKADQQFFRSRGVECGE